MRIPWLITFFALSTVAGCSEEFAFDPGIDAGVSGRGCGTNAFTVDGLCECRAGFDWCVPGDPNDLNCCAVGGQPDIGTDASPDGEPLASGEIIVQYQPVEFDEHRRVEEAVKATGLHEAMAELFEAGLMLPENLYVVAGECERANAFFWRNDDGLPIVGMCYELWPVIESTFATRFEPTDVPRLTRSTWLFVLLHEFGHAFVDVLDLVVVTAEEDVADAFATVMLVEMGVPNAAEAAAVFWKLADDGQSLPRELADEHSLSAQRFYNILCFIYGSEPEAFPTLTQLFPELTDRLERCPSEWEQARTSVERLLEPHRRGE